MTHKTAHSAQPGRGGAIAAAALAALIAGALALPTPARAEDGWRHGGDGRYEHRDFDHAGRGEWREHEWREHQRYNPYYSYYYGYVPYTYQPGYVYSPPGLSFYYSR